MLMNLPPKVSQSPTNAHPQPWGISLLRLVGELLEVGHIPFIVPFSPPAANPAYWSATNMCLLNK